MGSKKFNCSSNTVFNLTFWKGSKTVIAFGQIINPWNYSNTSDQKSQIWLNAAFGRNKTVLLRLRKKKNLFRFKQWGKCGLTLQKVFVAAARLHSHHSQFKRKRNLEQSRITFVDYGFNSINFFSENHFFKQLETMAQKRNTTLRIDIVPPWPNCSPSTYFCGPGWEFTKLLKENS